MDCTVGPAGPQLTLAALSLLPELIGAEALAPRLLVAYAPDQRSRPLGAAAFVPRLRDLTHPGFRCALRVLPAFRRQGIGHALLQALAEEARRWNVPRLHAWRPVDEASEEAAALQALGFARLSTMHHFIGTVDRALPAAERLESSLRARMRAPETVRIVPLHEVPREQVVSLYQRQLGGSTTSVGEHLSRVLHDEPARAISVAAWDGERVLGFMLLAMRDGCPEADFWVSDLGRRNGWIAALTLHASLQRIGALGLREYRFHCNEHVQATMNFARRTEALCVARTHCLGIDVNPGGAPS
jgi:GNAT superfamily N-acetyltransferase